MDGILQSRLGPIGAALFTRLVRTPKMCDQMGISCYLAENAGIY